MKKNGTLSLIAAVLLIGNSVYGYDEGGISPHTVKFGSGAGASNGSQGYDNTFIGVDSGYSNTEGSHNVFTGNDSGFSNTSGHDNIFTGYTSGHNNTTGYNNIFIGNYSGYTNTKGYNNVYTGFQSGNKNTTGNNNVFCGYRSGFKNTTGYYNTFNGVASGYSNTSGQRNVFEGAYSGYFNQNGSYNVFLGYYNGHSNTHGSMNSATGYYSGYKNTTGSRNAFIGAQSGYSNTDGSYNTFIGTESGYYSDVNNSIFLGYRAGYYATRNNTLYIANSHTENPLIYGEFDTGLVRINGELHTLGSIKASFQGSSDKQALKMFSIDVNNTNIYKKSDVGFQMTNVREDFSWVFRTWEPDKGLAIAKVGNGATKELRLYDTDPTDPTSVVLELANGAYCDGVWHDTSSRSMKRDIKDLDTKEAMKAFTKLRPVTYAYKANPTDKKVGFIAEDVPDLVADPGRKSLSPMDMVALLTKVVQVQEKRMKTMRESFEKKLAAQEEKISKLEKIRKRLSRLEVLLTNLALKPSAGKERLSSKTR